MFTKHNVKASEYKTQLLLFNSHIVNVPRPYSFKDSTLIMQMIPALSISDIYGENFSDVPVIITDGIRNIIATLYLNGVEYPDITGYNFIEYQDKIWIIDFGHASYNSNPQSYDPFIMKFINGHNDWNPNYK